MELGGMLKRKRNRENKKEWKTRINGKRNGTVRKMLNTKVKQDEKWLNEKTKLAKNVDKKKWNKGKIVEKWN